MTFAQIRSMIRSQTLVEDTNVTDSDLNIIINLGYQEIEASYPGWPWLQHSADLGVTASTRYTATPSGFSYAIAMTDQVEETILDYMSASSFLKLFGERDDETGDPIIFTHYDDRFYFFPTPDATSTTRLRLYYTTTITALSADGDIPAFHAAFHWALVEYGKWKIFDREEYYDQSERARIMFASYVENMVSYYQNQVKRDPFMFGDGGPHGAYRDNIPWLWTI